MMKISNKIENFLLDENIYDSYYLISFKRTDVRFGIRDTGSYITLLTRDSDDYLLSEKEYFIPLHGCLKYIRYGLGPLKSAIESNNYKLSKEIKYLYDSYGKSKVRLEKKIERIYTDDLCQLNKYYYTYKKDDLCEIRVKVEGEKYDQLIEMDHDDNVVMKTYSSFFENESCHGLITEISKIINRKEIIMVVDTDYGTVSSVTEIFPCNSDKPILYFDMMVEHEGLPLIYKINSENECIERISTEIVRVGKGFRHLNYHKLYRVSKTNIEKMMREE